MQLLQVKISLDPEHAQELRPFIETELARTEESIRKIEGMKD